MAVYKVIQDVEAEDKLIGFLSLKSFIYASIAALSAFIEFRMLVSGLGPTKFIVMFAFLGPMILFGVLASPLGREQPTEVWLLSRIKFFFQPRVRVWNQSGAKKLVTITAPKRPQIMLTKNLSQVEVKSRLQALATTLDSRGWALKSANVEATAAPSGMGDSDRLVAPSTLPNSEPVMDLHAADDIMDEQNNPTAQKFTAMIEQADEKRKKDMVDRINSARSAASAAPAMNTTFLDDAAGQPAGNTTFVGTNVVAPSGQVEQSANDDAMDQLEHEVLERKHRELAEIESRMPKHFMARSKAEAGGSTAAKAQAPSAKTPAATPPPALTPPPAPQVTAQAQAAKLELAQSGNDLSVASIAHLANHINQVQQIGPNEFEIDLH